MYGVTEYGFRRKLYSEALEERIAKAKDVFGVNVDTSETSFLGKLIRNMAWDEAYLWELAEDVYFCAYVNSAEGTDLDNVGMYLTITRRPAMKSSGVLTIYGTDKTVISKGFRVATESGIIFETVSGAVIENGSVDVGIVSVGAGKVNNVSENSIVKIINPQIGVDSVINFEQTDGGLDVETDDEFRARYKESYSRGGGSTVPAISAALLDIDGVVDADVIENVGMVEVDGIPPKAIACYVYGGTDEDVARAIFENKAGGIESFGEVYVYVKDDMEQFHKIGFTRAKVQYVWVMLRIKIDENFKGEDAIKRAILNYIGGIDTDNIEYNGLKLGKSVILTKVLSSVMCLGGVADIEVLISEDGINYVMSNIEIDKNTIARTSFDRVVIEYV